MRTVRPRRPASRNAGRSTSHRVRHRRRGAAARGPCELDRHDAARRGGGRPL